MKWLTRIQQQLRLAFAGDVVVFQSAIVEYVQPLSAKCDLSFMQIDPRLYALVTPAFYIKFYNAGGHGYNLTVCIGPTFQPKWNTSDEKGFNWLLAFVGRDHVRFDRYASRRAYRKAIATLAQLLPDYIGLLKGSNAAFWSDLDRYIALHAANKDQPQSMKAEAGEHTSAT